MNEITYTLLTDGSSDKRLIPILTWLLNQHCPEIVIVDRWVDLRSRPPKKQQKKERKGKPTEKPLEYKIKQAMELHHSDILFIHRDAEKDPHKIRVQEIRKAIEKIPDKYKGRPTVCVVPVRMQETWLLIDEKAIRKAVYNENGIVDLKLPKLKELENILDPKEKLKELLNAAAGHTNKKKSKKSNTKRDTSKKAFKVAENIEDFSPLRELPAFQSLEKDLKEALNKMNCAL